jgi:hypothetical protein
MQLCKSTDAIWLIKSIKITELFHLSLREVAKRIITPSGSVWGDVEEAPGQNEIS